MWKLARAAWTLRQVRRFSAAIPGPSIVHKRGTDILHDPWFNKVELRFFCHLFSELFEFS